MIKVKSHEDDFFLFSSSLPFFHPSLVIFVLNQVKLNWNFLFIAATFVKCEWNCHDNNNNKPAPSITFRSQHISLLLSLQCTFGTSIEFLTLNNQFNGRQISPKDFLFFLLLRFALTINSVEILLHRKLKRKFIFTFGGGKFPPHAFLQAFNKSTWVSIFLLTSHYNNNNNNAWYKKSLFSASASYERMKWMDEFERQEQQQ
jgi:hypothetical protein